jgi:hypothetical protein
LNRNKSRERFISPLRAFPLEFRLFYLIYCGLEFYEDFIDVKKQPAFVMPLLPLLGALCKIRFRRSRYVSKEFSYRIKAGLNKPAL